MHVGKANYDGAHLVFIWDVNVACPAHYLEIFDPIKDVIFATNTSRYVLDKHAKIGYENSLAVFHWTLQMNHIPKNRFGFPSWQQIEYNTFSQFTPHARIMEKINKFVDLHNVCNISSMHIRLTDLNALMPARKKISLQSFINFVESSPVYPIFLMTDDPKTQQYFIEKYGLKKIIVYDQVGEGLDPNQMAAVEHETTPIRYTTLEHTVIDVFIAAHAKQFHPSGYSSSSDLVKIFSRIGRGKHNWCSSS